ncbi:hypothetical protein HYFRA_00005634 [Hymenoscyphus fraxineus]|uniref:Uncharacterized protein n=1 Tax=Hymenoscyphus fraxineus TaxID=746836 RepID=A0A9N9PQ93_9HELO|nr:hypothetical protein HYFRA_00005634 [Hymenoscyphus fraxineus]
MHFYTPSILMLAWTVILTEASWIPGRRHIHLFSRSPREYQEPSSIDDSIRRLTPNISTPGNLTSGNLTATTRFNRNASVPLLAPLYDICSIGSNHTTIPASCISALRPARTTTCSTVIIGFYTSITVSDCSQTITFSTENGYSLVSTTASPTTTPFLRARQEEQAQYTSSQEGSPRVQKLRTYYAAPWKELAANNPQDIEVKTCKVNESDKDEDCEIDSREYILATNYKEVTVTSTLSISTTLSSPIRLRIPPNTTVSVPAGSMDLSTELAIPSATPEAKFSPVEIGSTSTVELTTTIEETSTYYVTMTLNQTLTSTRTSTITKTIMLASQTTESVDSNSSSTSQSIEATESEHIKLRSHIPTSNRAIEWHSLLFRTISTYDNTHLNNHYKHTPQPTKTFE